MYYPALLVMKAYKPLRLSPGMLFNSEGIALKLRDKVSLWALNEPVQPYNQERFILENGHPLEPHIIDPITGETLAHPHQIAYIDEGEHVDTLRDISIEDMNFIINECEGKVSIDIEEEGEEVLPLFVEDKAVLMINQ